MKVTGAFRLALLVAFALVGPASAWAGGVALNLGGVRATKSVRTFQDIRQASVVRQRWDLSCGSAALSTLLTYHHADPTPESAIIVAILRRTDPVRVRARGGFSLLDLKRFVEARGYEAKGYGGLGLTGLMRFGMPAIVPIRLKGYDHFVVFRGMQEDRVVLADPAFGNLTVRAGRFEEIWRNGIGFVVRRRDATPHPDDLALQPEELSIPDGAAISRALRGGGPTPPTRHGP